MMELFNEVTRYENQTDSGKAVKFEACSALVRLLSPFVPHITHELWEHLGYSTALINEAWPETDEAAMTRDELEMVVQVNGKLRASITVPADASKDDCESAALASADVLKHIDGLKVFKVIVVPSRLVNIVAK